jgi:hypothetical protein
LLEGLAAATNVGTENGEESLAIKKMKDAYKGAEQVARGSANPNLFYSALNALAAELILNSGCVGWAGLDQRLVEEIRSNLLAKRRADPDFWSSVGLIELHLYEALSQSRLAAERGAIEAEYIDLHERIASGWSWKSPRDQLRLLFSAHRPWAEEDQRAGKALLGVLHRFAEG